MADIGAVLKKTIDGLPRHDAAIRMKVYDKARSQIRAKLLAAKPDADQALIDRNMTVVERAIQAVEEDYRFQDELGDVLGPDDSSDGLPPSPAVDEYPAEHQAEPADPAVPADEGPRPAEDLAPEDFPPAAPELASQAPEPDPAPHSGEVPRADEPVSPLDEVNADTGDRVAVAPPHDVAQTDPDPTDVAWEKPAPQGVQHRQRKDRAGSRVERRHVLTALVVALVLVIAGGAGAYAFFKPDAFNQQLASFNSAIGGLFGDTETVSAENGENEPADGMDNGAEEQAAASVAPERPEKFTQRLTSEGTETDAGRAGETVDEYGEGSSIAPLTVAQNDSETPAPASDAEDTGAEATGDAAPSDEPAVQVGQRAIYSEERTANEQLRRLQGSVVWSQVNEQPGPGMEEEPALRADIYIPDTGTSLRMTLKRNGDPSLPASHVMELIFEPTTKEPGRGIREILRLMFKESEAAQGEPLQAFPAEISDNFFLMMLDEGQQSRQANLGLIRDRDWIDLLVTLETGRRALFTMEKGLPGAQTVEEVLEYWQANALPEN